MALATTAPVGSVTMPVTVPALPADWTRAGARRVRRSSRVVCAPAAQPPEKRPREQEDE